MDPVLAALQDSVPPYEGKDPNTSDDWHCRICFKHEGEERVHLRVCSRCKIIRYCSVDCQRTDYNGDHRSECRKIESLTKTMKEQAQPLRQFRGWFGGEEPKDLFHTEVGHFWGILDTRDYCRTRYELMDKLSDVAYWYEVRPLLEKVLNHQLELMRLMASDNLGLRDIVPFTLLSLNRDDDAHAFIKYWIPIMEEGSDVSDRHRNTSKGDWIYPRGQDKREDVFEVCGCSESYFPLAFLAALCIIKLRMIAAYKTKQNQANAFSETRMGRNLGDAASVVREAATNRDGEAAIMAQQERHVTRYFKLMQKLNPTLLPAIVNPRPLKSQPPPQYIQPGKPSEAWIVLMSCNRHFVRIPGTQDHIESIIGKNPTYDCQME